MVIGRVTILLAAAAVGTVPLSATVATNSSPHFFMFQFNVAAAGQPYSMVRDFNIGTLSSGVWKAPAFTWTTIAGEGSYNIRVPW